MMECFAANMDAVDCLQTVVFAKGHDLDDQDRQLQEMTAQI